MNTRDLDSAADARTEAGGQLRAPAPLPAEVRFVAPDGAQPRLGRAVGAAYRRELDALLRGLGLL